MIFKSVCSRLLSDKYIIIILLYFNIYICKVPLHYWEQKYKPVKSFQVSEQLFVLKVHYCINKDENLTFAKLVRFLKSKGFKSFSRQFFFNIFKGVRFGFQVSLIFAFCEYLNMSLSEIDRITLPESYKRKYLK